MKCFIKQALLIALFVLFSAGNGMAEINAIHQARAAVNQEIYNWIDIGSESITQILYYVDGVLLWGKTTNNTRYLLPHKFTQAGDHAFDVYVMLSAGTLWEKHWTMKIYNPSPTKSLSGALQYADSFAILPNSPSYWYFFKDCTNFVSQILHDGGEFPETSTWYYNWQLDHSNSWTVVEDFYNYIIANNIVDMSTSEGFTVTIGGVKTFTYPPLINAHPVKYKWQESGQLHNAFVVTSGIGQDGTLQPLIDAHSNNRYHTDWRLLNERGDNWVTTTATMYSIKWD